MSSLISVQNPEPELENLLRSLGIDFSLAGHYDNPLPFDVTRQAIQRLAE